MPAPRARSSRTDKPPAPRQTDPAGGDRTTNTGCRPGDKLRIEVYKDAQLSQSVQVRPDGKITLPLVGDIDAMGLTPIELRDAIAAALQGVRQQPGGHRDRRRRHDRRPRTSWAR